MYPVWEVTMNRLTGKCSAKLLVVFAFEDYQGLVQKYPLNERFPNGEIDRIFVVATDEHAAIRQAKNLSS